MWVSTYFVWFVVYSFFGWVYESTYSTIIKGGWRNRGFLYGPVCPIYGTGTVAMMGIWQALALQGVTLMWWQVFLIAFFGSMVLEYSVHWGLERLFHAYWWDYSNMPLNVNGRICLPASLAFGGAGLLIAYVLYEPTVWVTAHLSPLLIELLSLVLMAAIAADTAITVSALERFARAASAINQSLNDHMEQFVIEVQERTEAVADGLRTRQEQTESALASAGAAVELAAAGLDERAQQTREAIVRERDRFETYLRDSRLGDMGHIVRAAARRVKGFVTSDRMPGRPWSEQLANLGRDVRAKHWPKR